MDEELYILWTNNDLITSEKMVFMYAYNSIFKKWWKKVTIIIWGATTKLVASNRSIQIQIKEMMKNGAKFSACKACADQLGVSNIIEELGIELKYWGEPLTEIIKSNKKIITI